MIISVPAGKNEQLVYVFPRDLPEDGEIVVNLAENARAELFGLVVGKGSDDMKLKLRFRHNGPNAFGRMSVRALLTDNAKLDLRGMIEIGDNANGSDAYFDGRALLQSETASAVIIPELEIKSRDVKASHAAAVGPLDPEQSFFLQTRGLSPEESESMLTRAFALSFQNLPQGIREKMETAIG